MVTAKDIHQFLRESGVRRDDKVTVHVSLRAIGKIENGADGMIDAFSSYLSDGLFIVPTHTWRNVNRQSPYYDVRSTEPCIGTLARIAAFRPDGVRSLHPTHSVAAFGTNAADYVRGEEKYGTPAPPESALSRLYEENGKVLLIGVGHERNTYLHAVDERLKIPDRIDPNAFVITIRDYDGNLIQSPPYHHHHTTALNTGVSDYYPNFKEAFEYVGAVTYSQLGNALVYCCDARKMTDTVRTIWERAGRDLCLVHEPIPEKYYK
ncbi:MAG: AAC(3) family N-acetyltransferase [Clostridia bacterium]|nr:AAC(3) family N-acetyltransferase [Clostridia bacterium]